LQEDGENYIISQVLNWLASQLLSWLGLW
jgi:hypothetical protein